MSLKRTDIHTSLTKKGFQIREDGDHTFLTYHTTQGKKSQVSTKTSRGTSHKDISDNLVSQMSKQCKLTTKEFKELVDCSKDQTAYEAILIGNQVITLDPDSSDPNEKKQ